MICQLHIIILCKSGEPKRYTNLQKCAKLQKLDDIFDKSFAEVSIFNLF